MKPHSRRLIAPFKASCTNTRRGSDQTRVPYANARLVVNILLRNIHEVKSFLGWYRHMPTIRLPERGLSATTDLLRTRFVLPALSGPRSASMREQWERI